MFCKVLSVVALYSKCTLEFMRTLKRVNKDTAALYGTDFFCFFLFFCVSGIHAHMETREQGPCSSLRQHILKTSFVLFLFVSVNKDPAALCGSKYSDVLYSDFVQWTY